MIVAGPPSRRPVPRGGRPDRAVRPCYPSRARASGGMADAHGSGPCVRKDVGVQLPPRAQIACMAQLHSRRPGARQVGRRRKTGRGRWRTPDITARSTPGTQTSSCPAGQRIHDSLGHRVGRGGERRWGGPRSSGYAQSRAARRALHARALQRVAEALVEGVDAGLGRPVDEVGADGRAPRPPTTGRPTCRGPGGASPSRSAAPARPWRCS